MKLKNIFSVEDSEDGVTIEVTIPSEELAEGVEIELEINRDAEEIENLTDDVEKASDDVEDLEEAKEAVDEEVNDEESEGLSEVSVESIRTLLVGMGKRYGVDTRRNSEIIARENFSGSLATRRRNSEAVSESIGDFIKNVWNKIVSAVKAAWEKVTQFWNKHLSTLGRMKKKLEAMRKRVRDAKGSQGEDVTAPGSLQRLFFSADDSDIGPGTFTEYVKRHNEATGATQKGISQITGIVDAFIKDQEGGKLAEGTKFDDNKYDIGTEDAPLATGFFGNLRIEDTSDNKSVPDISFNKDNRKSKPTKDRKIEIADQETLKAVIDSGLSLIATTTKFGGNFKAEQKKISELLSKAEKAIKDNKQFGKTTKSSQAGSSSGSARVRTERDKTKDEKAADGKNQKGQQAILKIYQKAFKALGATVPSVNTKLTSLNVSLCKGILAYCSASLGNYEKDEE